MFLFGNLNYGSWIGALFSILVSIPSTIFIFVSMLAYSAQDLVLEPFAGTVFAMTPGESTRLGGLQNGGVLAGMVMKAKG